MRCRGPRAGHLREGVQVRRPISAGDKSESLARTILRNTFLNDRRRSRRDPVDVDADRAHDVAPPADPHDDPEKRLLRAVVDADVLSALDALPDRFLQAVWLRDVEDLAYAEIAARLEIPLGTVMSRISRGRRLLHRHLTSEAPRTDA